MHPYVHWIRLAIKPFMEPELDSGTGRPQSQKNPGWPNLAIQPYEPYLDVTDVRVLTGRKLKLDITKRITRKKSIEIDNYQLSNKFDGLGSRMATGKRT